MRAQTKRETESGSWGGTQKIDGIILMCIHFSREANQNARNARKKKKREQEYSFIHSHTSKLWMDIARKYIIS